MCAEYIYIYMCVFVRVIWKMSTSHFISFCAKLIFFSSKLGHIAFVHSTDEYSLELLTEASNILHIILLCWYIQRQARLFCPTYILSLLYTRILYANNDNDNNNMYVPVGFRSHRNGVRFSLPCLGLPFGFFGSVRHRR